MKNFFLAAVSSFFFLLNFYVHADSKPLVGISMPTKSSLRWIKDGYELKKALEDKGYDVDLQYAEDSIPNQIAQLESMLTKDAKALVVAPVDDSTLAPVLQHAESKNVRVISYDRLIRNTSAVDYYLTFDNFKVGVLQAQSLLSGLGYPARKGPFNIELFAGSPDDKNSFFFYDGAMSILQPLIDVGVLVVKSGQISIKKTATMRWSMENAQARMDNILSANYSEGSRVDAVLSPTDFLSRSIISSLRGVGYGAAENPWPIVCGQDAEIPSIAAIVAGEQYSTVFKDVRELGKAAVDLLDDMLSGRSWEQPNYASVYDNGVKVVPSLLMTPILVDKSNYKKVLIDSGYIKPQDLR